MTITESMGVAVDNSDFNHYEDGLLRRSNGIVDAIVFPRLREMGVVDADLHRVSMRLVRQVQAGRDADGAIAAFLGVVRCGVNGTRSIS